MSAEAARVAGIEKRMLDHQPTIECVLPVFRVVWEDTVHVARNAAFDRRLLGLTEQRAGVRFGQPVPDTLLLPAVLRSGLESYGPEAIADRRDVSTMEKYTALGEAQQALQKTCFARIDC